MSAPIYRDPVYDGATDPTVVKNLETGVWWMFYTQRRTTDRSPGHRWVHGTEIGAAVSQDDGRSWAYRGIVEGLGSGDTLWAPEVVAAPDGYRMYLTVVDGVPDRWAGPRARIVEFRSRDLERWRRIGAIDLGSERVIDAAVASCADGNWRLWYKNEHDGSTTWSAVSSDLDHWRVEGRAIPPAPAHEGPNVFELAGWFWLIVDEWRGLGVYRSPDGVGWRRQVHRDGLILDRPGLHPLDRSVGHHADVVVLEADDPERDTAVLFYFSHPNGEPREDADHDKRVSAIQVAALSVIDGTLHANRDVATPLALTPLTASEPKEGEDRPSARGAKKVRERT